MIATFPDQRGQATLLVIGIALVCFASAGLAVDLTRASLLRRTLQSVADSAAAVGASQLDEERYYSSGGSDARLQRPRAVREALSILRRRGHVDNLRLSADARQVRVVVGGRVRTSFLRLIGIDHVAVRAEAAAVPVLGEG